MHYQKHINDWRVNDIELCVKLDRDWKNLPIVLDKTVTFTEEWIKTKQKNPVNVAMEFRISRGCRSALVSPAYTQDSEAYYLWIEVLGSATFPNWWTDFSAAMRDEWFKLEPVAKPHWCKWWEPKDTKKGWEDAIKSRYATEIKEFKPFVDEKDPKHIFRTSFWEKILQ